MTLPDERASTLDESAAEPPSLRQFTQEFFTFLGADVRREDRRKNGVLSVELNGDLADYFGGAQLRLTFGRSDDQDCELVAHGSRMFDRMMTYLDGRGASTLLELPKRYTSSEELMRAVRPVNASITSLQMNESYAYLFLFNWHLTFRSDEKYEELYSVLLNENGERAPLTTSSGVGETASALAELFAASESHYTSDADNGEMGVKLPPMTQLTRLAESARKYAVYYADMQCVRHEAEILPRLYRTLNRITTYYGQQIEEVYDTHDRTGEKREALEQDMQRKIAEEVENHRLRVGVELFSYAVFQTPIAVAELTLSNGRQETQVEVRLNRYSGVLERPRCHSCNTEVSDIALDKNGHVTCDNCIEQCATCLEIVCKSCGVAPCPVCGKDNCADCGEMCWACGERACPQHIDACPICGDRVCHACQEECSHCGVRQCRSHLVADAVVNSQGEYELICEACAMRCPGCQQFSAKTGVCAASGQQFCENCLVTCAECGKRYGPGFYQISQSDGRPYCIGCLHECPSCGELTPDIRRCLKCGAEYCDACGVTCDICGAHCCAGAQVVYEACSHTLCTEHQVTCAAGGESICAICSDSCGICEMAYCERHRQRCRHCGQQYCAKCVGSNGVCDTCETLITGNGAPVNLSQEPCASDLEAATMARHYAWMRAGNHRYLVYEGRNRLMGGAIIVVDLTGGPDNVVEVRRIGLLEVVRDRFMRPDE